VGISISREKSGRNKKKHGSGKRARDPGAKGTESDADRATGGKEIGFEGSTGGSLIPQIRGAVVTARGKRTSRRGEDRCRRLRGTASLEEWSCGTLKGIAAGQ